MKKTLFEEESIVLKAFVTSPQSGIFKKDFKTFLRWSVKQPQYTEYKRIKVGMPPEPYGIKKDKIIIDELLAHTETVLGNAWSSWQWLYEHLEDKKSKLLLLNVIAYKVIGWKFVKLPLDSKNFWIMLKKIRLGEDLKDQNNKVDTGFFKMVLHKFNLQKYGYPIKLYSDAFGVFNEFIYSQYSFRGEVANFPKKGDCIIDCGACFGGTSLYFANLVGKAGKVLSFEFMPQNIRIFNLNIKLNSNLNNQIELIKAPVYSSTGLIMAIDGTGPATQVHPIGKGFKAYINIIKNLLLSRFNKNGYKRKYIKATTIDCEVKKRSINSVSLIKMDIEGSEYRALEGGKETIIKFKPILAISVYHRLFDFYEVPQFINNLNLGYKFFLQHSTVHGDETVLFAIPPK
jgi:FkbM family methyltransferase